MRNCMFCVAGGKKVPAFRAFSLYHTRKRGGFPYIQIAIIAVFLVETLRAETINTYGFDTIFVTLQYMLTVFNLLYENETNLIYKNKPFATLQTKNDINLFSKKICFLFNKPKYNEFSSFYLSNGFNIMSVSKNCSNTSTILSLHQNQWKTL